MLSSELWMWRLVCTQKSEAEAVTFGKTRLGSMSILDLVVASYSVGR